MELADFAPLPEMELAGFAPLPEMELVGSQPWGDAADLPPTQPLVAALPQTAFQTFHDAGDGPDIGDGVGESASHRL